MLRSFGAALALGAMLVVAARRSPSRPLPVRRRSRTFAEAKPEKAKRLVIVAGGDVNFGREAGQAILANPAYDPFQYVGTALEGRRHHLREPRIATQRSEGSHAVARNRLIFTGPPGGAGRARSRRHRRGLDRQQPRLGLRRSALFETLDNLARAGVANAGTGKKFEDAYAPAVVKAGGLERRRLRRHAHLEPGSFQEHDGRNYVAWARLNLLRKALEKARKEHDLVLFSYHGGAEVHRRPSRSDAPIHRVGDADRAR
jgi:hypothetical protein